MSLPAEKRAYPRIEVILKLEYRSQGDFLADYVHNVSGGGIFIATERNLPAGERLSFAISFPGLLEPLECEGEVRWRRPPEQASEGNPVGLGLAFIFRDEEQATRIREVIDGLTGGAKATAAPEPLPAPAPVAVPAPVAGPRPMRVLLAEDNPMVREMVRFAVRKFHRARMVTTRELLVIETEDGRKAMEALQGEPFDLAIIDFYMPVLSGGQLIRMIRQNERLCALPIIIISGGGEEAKQESYRAGADLYLGKPVLLNQLFDSLQRLLKLDPKAKGR